MEARPTPPTKPFLTVKEAAAIVGVCEDTIRSAIKSGQIPGRMIQRSYRIPRDRFYEWWTGHDAPTVARPARSTWV